MFGRLNDQPHPITGTTSPIFIPRESTPKIVRPGRDYFLVQVYRAQAAFTGPFWERIKRLIVTSQVNLNHPILGTEGLRAIQRSREVQRDHAEQLGLKPNLIKLVPAVMSHVSISIEFILDKENRLAALGGLINDDSFLAAISLAPGAAMVAKTVSGLAQKIITTFIPPEERQPILQFSGDFNLAASDLREGYYVILGTRDEHNPIPSPLPKLMVSEGELLGNGQPITQFSYIILDVRRTQARTRDLNEGAPWDTKLREAEDEAQRLMSDPLATNNDRRQAWEKCRNLLREAQILLRSDPNYLRSEADTIIRVALDHCSKLVAGEGQDSRFESAIGKASQVWQPNLQADRVFLDIPADEDLDAALDAYAEQVLEARRIIRAAEIQ